MLCTQLNFWNTCSISSSVTTYTFFLPLEFGVRHHALHALLHAPPLRKLTLQPLLSGLQLLLEWAFVVLIHVRGLLQDVDLKEMETSRWGEKSRHSGAFPVEQNCLLSLCTLYSSILDFFSSRSISVFWPMMTFSFSLSLLCWSCRKVSLAPSWPSNCCSIDFSLLARENKKFKILLHYWKVLIIIVLNIFLDNSLTIEEQKISVVKKKKSSYQSCWTALLSTDVHSASFPALQSAETASDHQMDPPAHTEAAVEDFPRADSAELDRLLCGKKKQALEETIQHHSDLAVLTKAYSTRDRTTTLLQSSWQLIFEGLVSVPTTCGEEADWPVHGPCHLHLLGHLCETHHQLRHKKEFKHCYSSSFLFFKKKSENVVFFGTNQNRTRKLIHHQDATF